MYNGNETLRGAGEIFEYTQEHIQEIVKCKEDIIYFAEKYFKIVSIQDGEHTITLWDFQKKILKAFLEPPEDKRHAIIISARQSSKTTTTSIYILHFILFNSDKTAAVLANKEDTAKEIMSRIKLAYMNLPYFLQQGITEAGWNAKSLHLENGSKIVIGTTSSSSIRSKTVSLLYIDEYAHIPGNLVKEFIESVIPTIYSSKKSKLIITSTPKGLNHFYDMWTNAVAGKNSFFPIRINWWDVPGRDNKFREDIIESYGKMFFEQEYQCSFIGSSATLIDADTLQRMIYREPLMTKYSGMMNIFELPREECSYLIGVDSGAGIGKNNSTIQVVKVNSERDIEQVATYANNRIDGYGFSQIIIEISKLYNEAEIMIENNGGGTEIANLIWHQYEYDRIISFEKKKLGVNSNVKTKLIACLALKRYIENGWLTLRDKNTISELTFFEERNENIFKATGSHNDDRVMSLAWAIYFLTTPQYENFGSMERTVESRYKIQRESNEDENSAPAVVFDD
jgi:hypothetical protein